MTRRQVLPASAIIGYYLASVLGHLEVALWLVQQRESALLGTYKLADFLPHAGALVLAAVVLWQILRAWQGCNHTATLVGWTVWMAAVVLVDRFLIYSFPEYLHYPQYALLAFLIARVHDPNQTAFAIGPVLLAVTALGIADEALQYTWITISYSSYLDFNDFLLDLLGGAAGLLLYYGFTSTDQCKPESEACRLGPDGISPHPQPRHFVGLRVSELTNANQSRSRPAADGKRSSARYGLLGFAWLGTSMLIAVAALKVTSNEPDRLQPIEREPSYSQWIPGPRTGRYYVFDPVSGTLLLAGLGALASTAPLLRCQTFEHTNTIRSIATFRAPDGFACKARW